jgi:hypothetical protein
MKLKSMLIAGMMMLPVVGYAENTLNLPDRYVDTTVILTAETSYTNCVPAESVIKGWELTMLAYRQSINLGGNLTTTECDPCSCPADGMADCYEFMAEIERGKVKMYKLSVEVLEAVKKYGICK